MARTIASANIGEALLDRDMPAIWAGGHVAVDERIGEIPTRGLELVGQIVSEAALFSFDDGA